MILDRNGDPLAVNVPAAHIYADPSSIKDPNSIPDTAAKLAPLIGRDEAWIERALSRNRRSHFVSLLRHAPKEIGDQIASMTLPGIYVGLDTRRSYPNDGLAAQVLGFTDGDMKGVEGVEHSQDKLLEGRDGLMVGEVDQKGRFLPGTIRRSVEPLNGHDITLTIDKNLQSAADAELAAAVKEHHAEKGVVVIMDPRTGEILALSNAPGYNPNQPRPPHGATPAQVKAAVASWRDGAVSDLYEPGSTLKTITASAVLQDEGLDAELHHVYCNGAMKIGKRTIHCAPDPPYYGVHGDEDLRGVLKESCNIGMAQFGFGLGADRLYDFEKKFGFLDCPGSGLQGEAKSHLLPPTAFNRFTGSIGWSKIQLADISFGQGISVTPLQLTAAYCAIANGGTLMRPHIIRSISQGDKTQVVNPEPIRKVLDPQVAAAVRSMLGTVVQDGTGKPAQIAGFSVGGKTGSAQVAGPHGYEAGHYVASFVGMVPLSNPRLVILCAVFEPQGVHWGAAVAAPVVHNLAKLATLEMHLLPDDPEAVDWDDHNKTKKHMRAEVTTVSGLLDKDNDGSGRKNDE
jgi:stage V sporulation protein D (sporulation-specific penicillin-binding protein)